MHMKSSFGPDVQFLHGSLPLLSFSLILLFNIRAKTAVEIAKRPMIVPRMMKMIFNRPEDLSEVCFFDSSLSLSEEVDSF